jgi:hypothetical protein
MPRELFYFKVRFDVAHGTGVIDKLSVMLLQQPVVIQKTSL